MAAMDFNEIYNQLQSEIQGLFGSKQQFNVPAKGPASTSPSQNVIPSSGSIVAPIHDEWHSSGGFTYQPNATHPTGHMGVDMRAPGGTPVYPMANGVVTNVGTDPKGGNVVNVQHDGGLRTYYAHLSTAKVQKGDKVTTNTVIGTVGNTGNASHTVPHLHFQVWQNGAIQDPAKYFPVPKYTNLSPEEKRRGMWLSDQAKQEAQAFNMKQHVEGRRVAFSREVDKLLKLASSYCKIAEFNDQSK